MKLIKYLNKTRHSDPMKKEVYLEDLVPFIKRTHVKLNLNFLNELLRIASKSNKPHRNTEFANIWAVQLIRIKSLRRLFMGG